MFINLHFVSFSPNSFKLSSIPIEEILRSTNIVLRLSPTFTVLDGARCITSDGSRISLPPRVSVSSLLVPLVLSALSSHPCGVATSAAPPSESIFTRPEIDRPRNNSQAEGASALFCNVVFAGSAPKWRQKRGRKFVFVPTRDASPFFFRMESSSVTSFEEKSSVDARRK